jgi:hypothetical protein
MAGFPDCEWPIMNSLTGMEPFSNRTLCHIILGRYETGLGEWGETWVEFLTLDMQYTLSNKTA